MTQLIVGCGISGVAFIGCSTAHELATALFVKTTTTVYMLKYGVYTYVCTYKILSLYATAE